jgi:hypothetical protein
MAFDLEQLRAEVAGEFAEFTGAHDLPAGYVVMQLSTAASASLITCRGCGVEVRRAPVRAHWFCSTRCRLRADYVAKLAAVGRKPLPKPGICQWCAEAMSSGRSAPKKWCSARCRGRAEKALKRGEVRRAA